MTLRNCRLLVVLTALALSSCPMSFKYGVENGQGQAVASVGVGELLAPPAVRSDPGQSAIVSD